MSLGLSDHEVDLANLDAARSCHLGPPRCLGSRHEGLLADGDPPLELGPAGLSTHKRHATVQPLGPLSKVRQAQPDPGACASLNPNPVVDDVETDRGHQLRSPSRRFQWPERVGRRW